MRSFRAMVSRRWVDFAALLSLPLVFLALPTHALADATEIFKKCRTVASRVDPVGLGARNAVPPADQRIDFLRNSPVVEKLLASAVSPTTRALYEKAVADGEVSLGEHRAVLATLAHPELSDYFAGLVKEHGSLNFLFDRFLKLPQDGMEPRTLLRPEDYRAPAVQKVFGIRTPEALLAVADILGSGKLTHRPVEGVNSNAEVRGPLLELLKRPEFASAKDAARQLAMSKQSPEATADLREALSKAKTVEQAERAVTDFLEKYVPALDALQRAQLVRLWSAKELRIDTKVVEPILRIAEDMARTPFEPRRALTELADKLPDGTTKALVRNMARQVAGNELLRLQELQDASKLEGAAFRQRLLSLAKILQQKTDRITDVEAAKRVNEYSDLLAKAASSDKELEDFKKSLPQLLALYDRAVGHGNAMEFGGATDGNMAQRELGGLLAVARKRYETELGRPLNKEEVVVLDQELRKLRLAIYQAHDASPHIRGVRETFPSAVDRGYPYGFASAKEFNDFSQWLQRELSGTSEIGGTRALPTIHFYGSSIRGSSHAKKSVEEGGLPVVRAFSATSDVDIAVELPAPVFQALSRALKAESMVMENTGGTPYLKAFHMRLGADGKPVASEAKTLSYLEAVDKVLVSDRLSGTDRQALVEFRTKLTRLISWGPKGGFWAPGAVVHPMDVSFTFYKQQEGINEGRVPPGLNINSDVLSIRGS